VAAFSSTSQGTPLVRGAAAIYWGVNRMAALLKTKDAIISTCTHDRLNIDEHQVFKGSHQTVFLTLILNKCNSWNDKKGHLKIYSSSEYRYDGQPTHHFSSVSDDQLLTTLNKQFNEGFYFFHLATVPTAPHGACLVFHRMTKSLDSYFFIVDIRLDQVVQVQLARQAVPLVIAGINTA